MGDVPCARVLRVACIVAWDDRELSEVGARVKCFNCATAITADLEYCLNCRAAVHCCSNCVYREEIPCRRVRGLMGPAAGLRSNDCTEWTPGSERLSRRRGSLNGRVKLELGPVFRT